ncbi:hypothetical protein P8452_09923 [Trifolium repens]|nr:hypothetical protein P8452_09923 [Trifolium repens]
MGGYLYKQYQYQHDADIVHIKMLRNNTFVTVTDSKGNVKLSGSAGSLKDLKSGQKLSRYAAEATAEVVGRRAKGLGLKSSVVMKIQLAVPITAADCQRADESKERRKKQTKGANWPQPKTSPDVNFNFMMKHLNKSAVSKTNYILPK